MVEVVSGTATETVYASWGEKGGGRERRRRRRRREREREMVKPLASTQSHT
jgi:GH24 family phage-related lysozyme (muramidase)